MEELSLHILDIVENSLRAGATDVGISIIEDSRNDSLTIEIDDDGTGMDADTMEKAQDPFYTTKPTKKVGLGLSLLREAARTAGGDLSVQSEPGRGTNVKAIFQYSHIDRQPIGDLLGTLKTLMIANPDVRFHFHHKTDDQEYDFDMEELGIASASSNGVMRSE